MRQAAKGKPVRERRNEPGMKARWLGGRLKDKQKARCLEEGNGPEEEIGKI